MLKRLSFFVIFLPVAAALAAEGGTAGRSAALTGQNAWTDYTKQKPGTFRKITAADLPAPFTTKSSSNGPDVVPRPADAWPQTVAGFKVELYASGLDGPREIRTAPNGDLFVAETDSGKIRVVGPPWKMSETPARIESPPRLGEHTAEVLRDWLGAA